VRGKKSEPNLNACNRSNNWNELEFILNRTGAVMGAGSLQPYLPLSSSLPVHFFSSCLAFVSFSLFEQKAERGRRAREHVCDQIRDQRKWVWVLNELFFLWPWQEEVSNWVFPIRPKRFKGGLKDQGGCLLKRMFS
jgi:hypothetical protein